MTEVNRLRVVLVGGSGFLGRELRARLVTSGHTVTVISRGASMTHEGWEVVSWDAKSLGPWVSCLEGADVVVHLAGERVDCKPTEANIDALIASREGTVRLVGQAIDGLDRPPSAWVQLSSLAIFGDSGDEVITEETRPPTSGPRQQVEVCQRWEMAYREATEGLERTVLLRPGIAIGGVGDPVSKQLGWLARFGLGGRVGSGQQWVSWLEAEDFFDLLARAVIDEGMSGLYHLTAPEPVTNSELMAAYRSAIGMRFGLSSPSPVVKLGAWLLGSDPGLALTGRRCIPARLLAEGYEFRTTDVSVAVASAIGKG